MRAYSPAQVQVKAAGGVRQLDRRLAAPRPQRDTSGASLIKDILDECKRRLVQMFGWLSAEVACASRWNRSRACRSLESSSGRNFKATVRLSVVSSALYTTPVPPPPSFSSMR